MRVDIADKTELVQAVQTLPVTPMVAILFGGERLMVTDWGAIATEGHTVTGLVTIANEGEGTGQPTIIGVMVLPEWRRQGIGKALLDSVVEEAGRRNLLPLRYDAISSSGLALAEASGYGPDTLTIKNYSLPGIELP